MTALGLIETKGLIPAIEAADTMLKAADVVLLEKNLASGGLVTITVAGEVAAVKAAVDSAVTAVNKFGIQALVSNLVIPRPDLGLEKIVKLKSLQTKKSSSKTSTVESSKSSAESSKTSAGENSKASSGDSSNSSVSKEIKKEVIKDSSLEDKKSETRTADKSKYSEQDLKKMSTPRLIDLALSLPNIGMSKKELGEVSRKNLIIAIINACRNAKE